MNKIIIAIDGYAACGKSTLALQLAQKLNYMYLDTGAMYRAAALYFLERDINWKEVPKLGKIMKNMKINFHFDKRVNKYITVLNGQEVSEKIRSMQVSNIVSEVSSVSIVRKFLVEQQQRIGKRRGIVMDGRDIGTTVFPKADLKIFVTADMETRIDRRYHELVEKNMTITKEEIRNNLLKRDLEETTRSDSPLRKADDAIEIDNTSLSQDEQLQLVYELAMKKIEQ